jgi:hypothetical protein
VSARSFSLPWELLVSPTAAWRKVAAAPSPWPSLLTQGLLLLLGYLLGRGALAELNATAYGGSAKLGSALTGVWLIPLNFLVVALLAGLLLLWLRVLGFRFNYAQVLTWQAYGLLPLYLGRALGLLAFMIVQPLADKPADALALTINPLGFNLAAAFAPLSYPWVLGLALDVFGVWSLVLLGFGGAHFLGLRGARLAWLLAALVLSWLLILTAVWQGLQRIAA